MDQLYGHHPNAHHRGQLSGLAQGSSIDDNAVVPLQHIYTDTISPDFVQPPPEKGPPTRNHHSSPNDAKLFPPPLKLVPNSSHKDAEGQGPLHPVPAPWSTAAAPPWSTATRPLSDIRELTEPSLAELNRSSFAPIRAASLSRKGSINRQGSLSRKGSLTRQPSQTSLKHKKSIDKSTIRPIIAREDSALGADRYPAFAASSFENVLPGRAPPMTMEFSGVMPPTHVRNLSITQQTDVVLPAVPPRGEGFTIPNRGRAHSPVKDMAGQRNRSVGHASRPVPSRTFHRPIDFPGIDIVESPCHRHPRFSIEVQLSAPLFVGGGTIEGQIKVVVEDIERIRHRRQLYLARCSIDLLGVEEISNSKRDVFLNLATELIDMENPPPPTMVDPLQHLSPMDPF